MLRIAPNPLTPDTLSKAWPPFLSAGSANPYYEFDGTVTIGRYQGRLQYIRCGAEREPAMRNAVVSDLFTPRQGSQSGPYSERFQIRAHAIVQTPRGTLRKIFDKLLHGIAFDGTRTLTATELRAFLHLEQSIKAIKAENDAREIDARENAARGGVADPAREGEAREGALEGARGGSEAPIEPDESIVPIAPDEAGGAVVADHACARLNGWIAQHNAPRRAEEALRRHLLKVDPERWPDIEALLVVPAVAASVWKDRRLLGWLIDRCPDHDALYRLAATRDPYRADPRPGLRLMLDDHHLMDAYVLPLLHNAIEPLTLLEATDALAPFRSLCTEDDAQLFWRDGDAGIPRSNGLWIALLGKATTLDQLVDLATFHPDVPHERFIDAALAQMGARQLAGYVESVDSVINEAMRAIDPSEPENRSRSLEIASLRRLVEQTLPVFLAGAQPTRSSIPRRIDDRRMTLLSIGTRIPDKLASARRHFGHLIRFDRLVSCTPCWEWDVAE